MTLMIADLVLAFALSIVIVEVVLRLPLTGAVAQVLQNAAKSVKALTGPASDHWKEKALVAYSGRTFASSGRIGAMLALVIGIAAATIFVIDLLRPGFMGFVLGFEGLIATALLSTLWALARRKLGNRAPVPPGASRYSDGDKLLHRLALQSPAVSRFLFRLDQKFGQNAASDGPPVFIAGLARAGTTILMRRIHASGAFRSLTYRDMPFVIAPKLAHRLLGRSRQGTELVERAHGDRVKVNLDSPESLDEVYWRVFDGPSYIHATRLLPHAPGPEARSGFVDYVGAIMAAGSTRNRAQRRRYLSKNNNNILRLPALREMFPDAVILIPFRAPVDHARSLLRQHLNFQTQQSDDEFVREYMGYLVHHEFGGDHRPFAVEGKSETAGDPRTLAYWLAQWLSVYRFIEMTAPPGANFVCYENLCEDPSVWTRIAHKVGIAPDVGPEEAFSAPGHRPDDGVEEVDPSLMADANALYERLRARSKTGL